MITNTSSLKQIYPLKTKEKTDLNHTSLFPYQEEGVSFLCNNDGGLLLDEQGLGKTIQAITALSRQYSHHVISRILVVCPAIMRLTWEQEIKDWFHVDTSFYPKLVNTNVKTQVITKKTDSIDHDSTIVVCSYEYMTDRYKNNKSLLNAGFDAVVFDESHKIKTPTSQRTKAALQLLLHDQFKCKILLTGTPITKGVDDLYTQLKPFLSKALPNKALGIWKNIWAFREHFMYKKDSLFGTEYYGCRRPDELKSILSNVSIRRKKADVLKELPALLHERVYIDVPKTLADESLMYVDTAIHAVMGDSWKGVDKDEVDHIATMRKNLGVAKLRGTVEYIKFLLDKEDARSTANKKKIVVFAYHNDVIKALHKTLNFNVNVRTEYIIGETSSDKRQEIIKKFQSDDDDAPQVLILNILAGGVGITLTKAHTEVFAELDWTPANIAQAEARCHRIGQTEDVNVVFLLAKDSLDSHIFNVIEKKMRVLDVMEL